MSRLPRKLHPSDISPSRRTLPSSGLRLDSAYLVEHLQIANASLPSNPQGTTLSTGRAAELVSIIERKRGAWSAAGLAELLECSQKHIYALARSGRLPHLRIGGMIRFDPSTTADWLRSHFIAA